MVDEKRERKNISLHIIITIESSQCRGALERNVARNESRSREKERMQRELLSSLNLLS